MRQREPTHHVQEPNRFPVPAISTIFQKKIILEISIPKLNYTTKIPAELDKPFSSIFALIQQRQKINLKR